MGKRLPKALSMVRCPFEVRWHEGEGFHPKLEDDVWLNTVGQQGWIVCSHDAKWQGEPAALKAINQHKIGCFYLYGANSLGFFKMKSLAHNYDKIVKICGEEKRPFIYRVTASNRLTKVL